MLNARGMIAFAIAGITAIFLSSVVPVGAAEPSVHRDNSYVNTGVHRYFCSPRQYEEGECLPVINGTPFAFGVPPVKYTDFDISKALNPWEEIMLMQLAIGALDDIEERERLALQRLQKADKFVWDMSGWTFAAIGLLAMLFTWLMGFIYLKKKDV